MPAEGFRAAQAYVEVTARLDEDRLLDTARRAGQGVEDALQEHGRRAGSGLTDTLGQAGEDAGQAVVRSTEGRLRDAKGRFLAAGSDVGKGIGKGAEDETDRNGFRAFLGFMKHAPKAGFEAAQGLVGALKQGVSGPAGPYLIAGLSAGAVVAGPFIGALLAGGIMAGVAAGGIGTGVILAAKDPAVKYAWAQTGDAIGDILQDAASPFKGELIETASRATAAFERWRPMFNQIFGVASTMLDPFVGALEKAGDRLLPSIMTMINNAGPAVDAVASGIGGVVDAVSDVMDSLQDNGPEAAVALKAAFFLVESSIRNVGMVVNGLTEGFGHLIEFGLDWLGLIVEVGQKIQGVPGPLGAIGEKMAGMAPVLDQARGGWEGLKGQIKGATDVGSQGTSQLSDKTKILSLSMGAAIQQAGGLSAAFKLLNGGALNAREAESAYQAAIDNVSASIKQNGKTLDLHTAKGRANDAAIRQLINTTDQKAQATYDEVNATKGSAAAQTAAAKVYEQGRAQLIKNLTQILGNATAARKMADQIMGIPKSWSSNVTVKDNASGPVGIIQKRINGLHGKTVTVAVKYETHGSVQGEHIIGRGTLTKAMGGEITGGSGWRDDVPVLAMGGEWVIQKKAVEALTHQFGPGFMQRLNTWHVGGRGGPNPHIRPAMPVTPHGTGVDGLARPAAPAGTASHTVYIGAVTLDASGMKSIQDVVELISGLTAGARSYRARTATVARG